jgi:hypothetical protein
MLTTRPTFHDKQQVWMAKGQGQGDPAKVIVAAKVGFDAVSLKNLLVSSESASECVTTETVTDSSSCVTMEINLYPHDIMTAETRFAELARWMFYGKRAPLHPRKDPSNKAPRCVPVFYLVCVVCSPSPLTCESSLSGRSSCSFSVQYINT